MRHVVTAIGRLFARDRLLVGKKGKVIRDLVPIIKCLNDQPVKQGEIRKDRKALVKQKKTHKTKEG